MEFCFRLITHISGYAAAALAVLLLLRCARSMLRERYEPEVWAYIELPDGSSRSINNWECILGSSSASDIVLRDTGVSRSHASLQRSPGGRWTVMDLKSRAGTTLNGQAVSAPARLRDGDTLCLGGCELRFILLSAAQRRTLQRRRAEPGRRITPAVSLMLLSLFQMFVLFQLAVNISEAHTQSVILAFIMLMALEWLLYLLMRLFRSKGFEPETLAFFLSTVGLAVTATAAPQSISRHLVILTAGVCAFVLLGWWLRDLRRVKLMRWPLGFAALAFLAANLMLSEEIFGAKNWLSVGGVMLQPSEFVKVAYVYAGASTLDRLFQRRNLYLYIAFSAVIVGALALMGDFGTALVFFVCFLVVSFMRSGSFATVFLALSGAGLAGFLVLTVKPHVAQRFATWGSAWDDPLGAGYQQVRAMSAAASGGLFGQGAGRGWLKDVVAADTDLVFAVVSEELGLIVAVCCILALILLALFTVRNASAGRSAYYVIAGCASVSILMTQVLLNVFGSLDILPFTGVTFPFVSRGGSSLLSCWMLLAFMKAGDTRQNASFAMPGFLRSRDSGDEDEDEDDRSEEYEDGDPGYDSPYDGTSPDDYDDCDDYDDYAGEDGWSRDDPGYDDEGGGGL